MNIYEKLLAVQTALKAPKNRRNTFGKYNYRSCEDILEAVKPILKEVQASVFVQDSITEHNDRIYVMAMAYFVDVEHPEIPQICVTAYAREPLEKKGMDEPQITGTASSYARKYALNGLFLIDDIKDPDSDEYRTETEEKAAKTEKVEKASSRKKKDTDASVLDQFVDAAQRETLNMLISKAGITEEKFCSVYGIPHIPEFPAAKYDEAVKKLEAAIKAHKDKEDK